MEVRSRRVWGTARVQGWLDLHGWALDSVVLVVSYHPSAQDLLGPPQPCTHRVLRESKWILVFASQCGQRPSASVLGWGEESLLLSETMSFFRSTWWDSLCLLKFQGSPRLSFILFQPFPGSRVHCDYYLIAFNLQMRTENVKCLLKGRRCGIE